MSVDNSLASLLRTLATSIESATKALPNDTDILPAKEGISLLDVKNDLLLSYLQNLAFLILLKLRNKTKSGEDEKDLTDDVVKKLVELRVYLEKGVRPLENRLKYQIDKVVQAADQNARTATAKPAEKPAHKLSKAQRQADDSDISDSGSEGSAQSEAEENELTYGPNLAAFTRPKAALAKKKAEDSKDGIYRPPRIHQTAMPTTVGREERGSRRPEKSATLDEFIATELSGAPLAEPSIGSTIVSGGRRVKSDRERAQEKERQEYEENNFVRLPAQSKTDKAKNRGQARDGGWGGEEWRGLGAGLDRIERLTQKGKGSSGSLAKSRKRPISDGPRDSGANAGEMFEKRRKVVSRYRK